MSIGAVVVLLAAGAGAALGLATRWWLAGLTRGAVVPVWWCVAGVGSVWAAVAIGRVGGVVPPALVPLLAGLGWLTVTGSAVDVRVRRLPDAVTLPALPGVLATLVPLGGSAVLRGVAAALLTAGAYAGVRRCAPAAMGGGDVKLAGPVGPVGAALGGMSWSAVALGAVLAALLTACAGLVARRPGHGVPHGPSMLVAGLAVVAGAAAWPGPGGAG